MDSLPVADVRGAYTDPVRSLLFAGEPADYDPARWLDYATRFGIGDEHVGELIRMACDPALNDGDADGDAAWAPVHAWRALGQLRAEAAVAPLLAMLVTLEGDAAADSELPVVFGMIGPAAMAPIAGFLADRSKPTSPLAVAMSGITEIVARHPECRPEGVELLIRMLEPHPEGDRTVAGFAVGSLLDLAAVEAIDAIRAAFARDGVDITIPGDLEDVEVELGLRERRATPKPRYNLFQAEPLPPPAPDPDWKIVPVRPRSEKVGRNEPCPCGSGKKYKKCCLT